MPPTHLAQDLVSQREGPLQGANLGGQPCRPDQAFQQEVQGRQRSWRTAQQSRLNTHTALVKALKEA